MKASTKILIAIPIGLVLSLVLIFVLINPALGRLEKVGNLLRDKKVEHATLDLQIRAFKVAQSDLAKADKKEKIVDAVKTKEELVAAVISIESAVDNTNSEHTLRITEDVVQVGKGAVKPPEVITNKSGIEEVIYRLAVTNDYVGMIDMIKYLEHLPQFTEITKVTLAAETTEGTTAGNPIRTGRVLGTIDSVFIVKKNEAPAKTN